MKFKFLALLLVLCFSHYKGSAQFKKESFSRSTHSKKRKVGFEIKKGHHKKKKLSNSFSIRVKKQGKSKSKSAFTSKIVNGKSKKSIRILFLEKYLSWLQPKEHSAFSKKVGKRQKRMISSGSFKVVLNQPKKDFKNAFSQKIKHSKNKTEGDAFSKKIKHQKKKKGKKKKYKGDGLGSYFGAANYQSPIADEEGAFSKTKKGRRKYFKGEKRKLFGKKRKSIKKVKKQEGRGAFTLSPKTKRKLDKQRSRKNMEKGLFQKGVLPK